MLGGDGGEGDKDGRVDGASIIHEGADDLLGEGFKVWWCAWGEVDGGGTLDAGEESRLAWEG